MSKLLVTVDHQFVRTPDGRVWVKTIYGYDFWKRYLNIFESVRIACRIQNVAKVNEEMLLSSGDKVEFYALPQYRGPKEFALRYFQIKKRMNGVADGCDCALFRIPSPIANGVQKEAAQKGLPWVVEVVNDPWDTFAPGSFKSVVRPLVRLFFTFQVKRMARKANGASYVTQFALQKRYPAAASLYGTDEKHFESYSSSIILRNDYFLKQHKLPTSPYTIVHINSCITDYSKGHDVVIKVLKIIRDAGLDARVVFVGDGPARPKFEKMAQDMGVDNYVNFTGLLSSPLEVRKYLVDADLMIFPTKGEGLPRTVIESMAVGLPCLSTAVNGIPELLPNECMFKQQDAEAFAQKAIELLNNKDEWTRLSQQALKKATEYEESELTGRRNDFYYNLKQLSKV